MVKLSGQLAERPVIDVIRSIYLERRSGVLEVEQQGSRRRFYFVGGELHLAGSHPLAKLLSDFLEVQRVLERDRKALRSGDDTLAVPALQRRQNLDEATARSAPAKVFRELNQLVERIADFLAEWGEGTFTFSDDLGAIPLDLVGPLPTAYLVMEGAVRSSDEFELLRKLGGEGARIVANAEAATLPDLYGIEPEEAYLLSRLEVPLSVGELLRQVSLPREEALRKLCRMQAVNLICREEEIPRKAESEVLSDSLMERFLESIRQDLRRRPLELDPDNHRSRLGDLLSQLGGMTHYELLNLRTSASSEEVHAAYENLARLVHPDHAERLGLRGKDAAIRMLFERATEAYLVLGDPDRRQRYDREAVIDSRDSPSAAERSQEQRAMARRNFERALELQASEDYHFALELVQQAVSGDPRAEYYALQAEIQAMNPHWLRQASESYRQAVLLQPDDPDLRVAFGKVLEKLQDFGRAKLHYRAALQVNPKHAQALSRYQQLAPNSGEIEIPIPTSDAFAVRRSGFWQRLLRKLRF